MVLRCSLAQVVQAKVQQIYADRALPYPGGDLRWARTIRQRWTQTFGKDVVVILDWYHLTQKLRNLMSMIVATKLTSKPISRFYSRIFGRGSWSSYQLLAPASHPATVKNGRTYFRKTPIGDYQL